MSEFMCLFRCTAAEQQGAMGTPEQAQQSMEAWLSWIRGLEAGGHLKDPGQPIAPSGKIVRGSPPVVTDGPFAEAKDIVFGFIVIEARDMAQAVDLIAACPMVEGGGSAEIRPIGMPGL